MPRGNHEKVIDLNSIAALRRPRLSCCMIAADEEASIGRAIASVRDLADEVIVVDTGSRDGTVRAAQAAGARVISVGWRCDFSVARNFALARARGEWVLILDADEAIAEHDYATIRECCARSDADAFTFEQRTYGNDPAMLGVLPVPSDGTEPLTAMIPNGACGFVPYRQVRLFRNNGRFTYRGRVFEELVRVDEANGANDENVSRGMDGNGAAPRVDAVDAGAVVHHYGRMEPSGRIYRTTCAYLESPPGPVCLNNRNVHYAFETAVQLFVLDRLTEARILVTRCLEVAPRAWQCLNLRGLIDLRTGMTREAIDWFRRALHLADDAVDLHHNLGAALMESGEPEQALAHFDRCIALDGADARVLELAADAARACGRTDGALRYASRALAADPHRPRARVLMAEIRFAGGDRRGALDALAGLRFIPEIKRSLWMRSIRLFVAMEELDEAERFADRAVLEHPESDTLCLVRGHILELCGRESKAIAAYRRLLERDPDNPLVLMRLGCLSEQHGDLDGALRSMRSAHRLDPRDNRVQVNLAIILQRLGRNDEAERHLRAAMKRGADDGVACNALGCILANSGRYDESILYFERAVSLEPANELFRTNLRRAHRRLSEPVRVS